MRSEIYTDLQTVSLHPIFLTGAETEHMIGGGIKLDGTNLAMPLVSDMPKQWKNGEALDKFFAISTAVLGIAGTFSLVTALALTKVWWGVALPTSIALALVIAKDPQTKRVSVKS